MQSDEPAHPSSPRIRFVYDCKPETSAKNFLLFFLAFLAINVPLALLMTWVQRWSPLRQNRIASVAMMVATMGISMAVVFWWMRRFAYRKRSRNPFRIGRLERLLKRPDATKRLPHRFVEDLCYGHPRLTSGLKKGLSGLQPGEIIVVDCPRDQNTLRIHRTKIVFEPIPLDVRDGRLRTLLSAVLDDGTDPPSVTDSNVRPKVRWYKRPFWVRVGGVFYIIVMIAGPLASSRSGSGIFQRLGGYLLLMLVIWGIIGFQTLVIGRQYFLVPGALVRLKNGLRYRTPELEMLTLGNASIVLFSSGGCYIVSGGKAEFTFTDSNMSQGLIMAWLSEAPTPTMAELQTLLAPEAAVASKSATPG